MSGCALSRIRGALVGSVIGDCLGGIHDTLPQSFAEAAARADPHSLKGKLVRSGDRHIFRFSADSLGIFAASEALLTSAGRPEKIGDTFRSSLISAFTERRGIKKPAPTSLVVSSLAGDPLVDVEKFRLSGNCAAVRAIPCGLVDPALAATLAATTHTHPQALAASLALAKYIDRLARSSASGASPALEVDPSLMKKMEMVEEIVVKFSHDDDEETDELQEAFRRRVGFNASASVSLAAGYFGLVKAAKMLAEQQSRVVELPAHLRQLRASERSKNLQGNSNRLDASRALDREDPVIIHDSPFVLAVSWAISVGGDTRTNACVAGALAGARWGVEAIPEVWQTYCEGTETARVLADALHERFHAS